MNLINSSCQQCKVEFSDKIIPLLLPDCGHSICGNCIAECLEIGQTVSCQVDNIESVNRTQLSDFPRNFALLQLITSQNASKQKRSSGSLGRNIQIQLPSQSEEQQYFVGTPSYNSETNHFSNATTATKQRMVDEFVRKQIQSNKNVSQDTLSENNSNPPQILERCSVHRKKNDILCIQCKIKICSNCALFEGHKTHQVITVNDAIQKISRTVQNLTDICQKVEQARLDMKDESLNQQIKNHLNEHLQELMSKIETIFREIQEQINSRRIKFEDDVRRKCNKMEAICLKHLGDLILDSGNKADLWCMSTKSKLNYFHDQNEKGEIAIDLLQEGGRSTDEVLYYGEKVLKELENTKMNVYQKMQELGQKKLNIEFKGGLDRLLEGMLIINLKPHENDQLIPRDSSSFFPSFNRKPSQSSKVESATSQYFTRMIVGDGGDPSLLKDLNHTQLFIDPIAHLYMADKFQEVINYPSPQSSPQKVRFENHELVSCKSQVAIEKYFPATQLRQGPRKVSVSPNSRRQNQTQKFIKIPDKFQLVIQCLQNDELEIADFTGAGMGEDLLKQLIPSIVASQKLKILKLSRNNLSDAVVIQLLEQIMSEQNKDKHHYPTNIISSINLSNNMLTDKIVEFVLEECREYSNQANLQSLRSLQMSLNLINGKRVKKNLLELKQMGVNIYI